MPAQTAVLPKGSITQDPARYPCACLRRCPVVRWRRGLRALSASAQEDREIEMRFAQLKRILKLGRLRLRGPQGAQYGCVPAAMAESEPVCIGGRMSATAQLWASRSVASKSRKMRQG